VRRGTRSRLRSLGRLQALAVVVALAFPLVTAERAQDLAPPIAVSVRDEVRYLPPDTTFGDVVRSFHLHAHTGALLDVDGGVLDAGRFPGRILLNGREATGPESLSDGDAIVVVSRPDRTEDTVRTVVTIPAGSQGNPQFYLGTTPGEQIVVTGKISGKIVSSTFHATGPTATPNTVALTFDDGPNPVYTPQILAILQRFGVQATFFCIGFEVRDHPDVVQQERLAGMTIGNHSWDHPTSPPFRDLAAAKMRGEMLQATEELRGLGVDPFVFRPPGGTFSDAEVALAGELGMRVVVWSVDPQDWRDSTTAKQIVKNVLGHVHAGSIVLMHDGGGTQDATVKALPKVIKGIQKMGLGFVPLVR
jgi:peptidoglycan/xylan/chitin deacetylase (PgdA/CDA1 family)